MASGSPSSYSAESNAQASDLAGVMTRSEPVFFCIQLSGWQHFFRAARAAVLFPPLFL